MNESAWTKLYVVRHGETRWNHEGRWQGWQDSDLTENGRRQAREAARLLSRCGAQVLYTSDAGRALETATIINETLGAEFHVDSALRERYYGEYEGMTSAEIDGKFPGTRYKAGRDRRDTWRPVGGESLVEVKDRVMVFVRQVAQAHTGQVAVLVTHAGVLRVLDAVSSHESLDEIWDRVPPNCAVFELEANPQGDIRVVNHFAQIEAGEA